MAYHSGPEQQPANLPYTSGDYQHGWQYPSQYATTSPYLYPSTANASQYSQGVDPNQYWNQYQPTSGPATYHHPLTRSISEPYYASACTTGSVEQSASAFDAGFLRPLPYRNYQQECPSEPGEATTPGSQNSTPDEGANSDGKFPCPAADCGSAFKRKADTLRHYNTVHNKKGSRIHHCDAPRCSRKGENGFTRKDHLTEHLRNYHHRIIPKRRKGKGVEEDWQPQELGQEEKQIVASYGLEVHETQYTT